jgi:hypothetical protein
LRRDRERCDDLPIRADDDAHPRRRLALRVVPMVRPRSALYRVPSRLLVLGSPVGSFSIVSLTICLTSSDDVPSANLPFPVTVLSGPWLSRM